LGTYSKKGGAGERERKESVKKERKKERQTESKNRVVEVKAVINEGVKTRNQEMSQTSVWYSGVSHAH
jgi:methionine salvage enolase-phosphatase E1